MMWLFVGGVQSTSVAEVAENINKMLKDNYKKIAMLNLNRSFYLPTSSEFYENAINLNLDFIPRRIIAIVKHEKDDIEHAIDSKYNFSSDTQIHTGKVMIHIDITTKSTLKFVYFALATGNFFVKEIIAIE